MKQINYICHIKQKTPAMNDKYNYKTIYTTVKEDIQKGVYPTGTLLPTELTLADKYSVSRPTVSKVYNQLQKEGYVNKKKGLGTLVLFKGDTKKHIHLDYCFLVPENPKSFL